MTKGGTARFRAPMVAGRRFVNAHQIEHWAHGGETSLDNLVLLCRGHHRLVHEGGYAVERLPAGGVRFRYPYGAPIPDSPRSPPAGVDGLLEIEAGSYRRGAGDPMDLALTLEALLAVS